MNPNVTCARAFRCEAGAPWRSPCPGTGGARAGPVLAGPAGTLAAGDQAAHCSVEASEASLTGADTKQSQCLIGASHDESQ